MNISPYLDHDDNNSNNINDFESLDESFFYANRNVDL